MKSKVEILKTFSKKLKTLRESKELTQMDLAVSLDTTPGYISRLENGHTEPGITVLYTLAEALDCNPSDLL
jgi:transcriptional regulator with XRE-family HTH domain